MSPNKFIEAEQVNAVINAAIDQSRDGDVQMSLLVLALVGAAHGLGVPKAVVVDVVSRQFDQPLPFKTRAQTIDAPAQGNA